jgi:hypothetical protein
MLFIKAHKAASLLFMHPLSRKLTTMVLAATVDPMDTTNDEAHVSGRLVDLNRGLAKRDNFCIRPSSIRRPVPNRPMDITIRTGIAKSRALIRISDMNYGRRQELN